MFRSLSGIVVGIALAIALSIGLAARKSRAEHAATAACGTKKAGESPACGTYRRVTSDAAKTTLSIGNLLLLSSVFASRHIRYQSKIVLTIR